MLHSSTDTLTEGAWGVDIPSNLHWSSTDTLTEGAWGVDIPSNFWSSTDTLTEGAWGVDIPSTLVIHGYSDRGGMGCDIVYTGHPRIL